MGIRFCPAAFVPLFFVIVSFMTVVENHAETQRTPPVQAMQSPVLGFVYSESSHEIRAILGIPGASVLGDSLALGSEVTRVHFAPGQGYAMVEREDSMRLAVLKLGPANFGSFVEIPGALSPADILTFSPRATAVAVYSGSEGRLQVITGLPDAPRVQREVNSLDASEPLAALVVTDDGRTLMLATVQGTIYRLVNGADLEFIDRVEDFGGMVLAAGSNDALIANHHGRVVLLQNLNGVPSRVVVSESLSELEGDIRLFVDQGSALITSEATNRMWRVDLKTREADEIVLFRPASMIQPMRSSRRFLMSYEPGAPTWILDTNSPNAGVFFVPAEPTPGTQCTDTCASERPASFPSIGSVQ
jgi:hypothetical protein